MQRERESTFLVVSLWSIFSLFASLNWISIVCWCEGLVCLGVAAGAREKETERWRAATNFCQSFRKLTVLKMLNTLVNNANDRKKLILACQRIERMTNFVNFVEHQRFYGPLLKPQNQESRSKIVYGSFERKIALTNAHTWTTAER